MVLSAAVEPWRMSETLPAPKSAARSRVISSMTAAGLRGLDKYLRMATISPRSSSKAVTSVKVPPTSMPTRKLMDWVDAILSCPALCRASTSCSFSAKQDVDGRDKPGHDVEGPAPNMDDTI